MAPKPQFGLPIFFHGAPYGLYPSAQANSEEQILVYKAKTCTATDKIN